jgi:hypothetical protein
MSSVTELKNAAASGRTPHAFVLDRWLSECHDIEEFIEQLLADLDDAHGEMQRRAHELELMQARLEERERQLCARDSEAQQMRKMLVRQDEQLGAALAELTQLRSALLQTPAPGSSENTPGSRATPGPPQSQHTPTQCPADASQDQVLDSVQKQFEHLRNDARRRQTRD